MKVSVIGPAKLLGTGDILVPITIDKGPTARKIDLTVPAEDMPPAGLHGLEPHRLATLSLPGTELYLFHGKVVQVNDATHLSEDEIKLEVAHAVLQHERGYQQLRRQLDAFKDMERAEVARRERIPENVRLFVWQRDQGRCVKWGSNERLEFDHIIPVTKGGGSTERNVQLLCERCNREKGANV